MANQHSYPLSQQPNDPYSNWRESVLSTRSLSYLSTITDLPGFDRSRQASLAHSHHPTRKNTLTSESDYDLEMAPRRKGSTRDMSGIPELPESVAESPLFVLPREIRDRIYSFCLTAEPDNNTSPAFPRMIGWPNPTTSILTNVPTTPTDKRPALFNLQPQLLRTCQIIYAEAARLLYTLNYFSFDHPSDANVFARALASPQHTAYVTKLALQIKSGELRLWMPYITSTDSVRSLKADFPRLRELWVRYRSGHWNQSITAEANLRVWDDDPKLKEIMDGLKHVYLTPPGEGQMAPAEELEEFERHVARNPGVIRIDSEADFKKQLLEFQKAKYAWKIKSNAALVPPIIRVASVCRISTIHDSALTDADATTAAATAATDHPQPQPLQQQPQHGQMQLPHLSATQGQTHAPVAAPQQPALPNEHFPSAPLIPVREGEKYRGFTTIDLREGYRALFEDEKGQIARITRTPFTSKEGILLALEVYSVYGGARGRT